MVSLVDPHLAETDSRAADEIADENLRNIKKMLNASDWGYYRSGRKCWYNSKYGTAIIVDDQDKIDQVKELLRYRPYSIAYGSGY